MRKVLLIGTVAALGAVAGAAYAANPNVPSYSPYALMDVAPSAMPAFGMGENRAAYVDVGYGAAAANPTNTNVPSYSPYAIMPQAQ
jgi:hypothetical protein